MMMKRFAAPLGVGLLVTLGMALSIPAMDLIDCEGLGCLAIWWVMMLVVALICALVSLWVFYVTAVRPTDESSRTAGRATAMAIPAALTIFLLTLTATFVSMLLTEVASVPVAIGIGGVIVFGGTLWGVAAVRRGGVFYAAFLVILVLPIAAYILSRFD